MDTTAYKLDRWDVVFYISMAILVLWIIGKTLGLING